MLSIKYNPPLYKKLLGRTLLLAGANSFLMFNASQNLQSEFTTACNKYFSKLSDADILDYDNRMKLQIEQSKQRQ